MQITLILFAQNQIKLHLDLYLLQNRNNNTHRDDAKQSLGRAIKSCPPLVTLHYIYPRSPATCSCNCRSDGVQCMQSLIDAMITD